MRPQLYAMPSQKQFICRRRLPAAWQFCGKIVKERDKVLFGVRKPVLALCPRSGSRRTSPGKSGSLTAALQSAAV